jgi:hypothetical protein
MTGETKLSLLCGHCGQLPSDHVVRRERLTCREDGHDWQWSDEDRVRILIEAIDNHDRMAAKLRTELFLLTEKSL